MEKAAPPIVDIDRAREIWDEYQKHHDVTPFTDQAVGIEPISGRIWFGESGLEIRHKMLADGIEAPFYCVRVGYDYYVRKGVRR